MERDEFKILVKAMKAVYPQPTFIPDQDAFNVWYMLLQDIPYQVANAAIQKYMLTEKFMPTIAAIREKCQEVSGPDRMNEMEAWTLVHKAICNSGYNSEEEFAKLPKACQIAVGNPANLREWALMESKMVESMVQARFFDAYKIAEKRVYEDAKLPESVRKLIAEIKPESQKIEQKETLKIEETSAESARESGVPMPEHIKQRMQELLGSGKE